MDCLICSMESSTEPARVFADDLWAAEVAPGYEVPGWFFLRVRRHAELLTGLDGAELSSLGPRARDLVAAVEQATGAPAVYLMTFGETHRHFHAVVAARGADVPPEQRGGALLQRLADHRDPGAAYALACLVRAAYLSRQRPLLEVRSS